MPLQFDHEKLIVYQKSIHFVAWAEDNVLADLPKSLSAADQFDRASTSIPLNIAEGNGKFTEADRCRYFDNAKGSALECASALDVLVAKKRIAAETAAEGKSVLVEIFSKMIGLIRANSSFRVAEEPAAYGATPEDKE